MNKLVCMLEFPSTEMKHTDYKTM